MDEYIQIPLWKQVILYFGTVVGVFFSSAVMRFNTGKDVNIDMSLSTIMISIIIAFLIIPIIFEKLRIHPNAPFLVQFGLFVQDGVFWYLIFNTIGKIIT